MISQLQPMVESCKKDSSHVIRAYTYEDIACSTTLLSDTPLD